MQTCRKNAEDMSLLFLLKYFENGPYFKLNFLHFLYAFYERPFRNRADALAVPARDTLNFTALCRVLLGIPTGTRRAPVTFSEKEDNSPLIAGRAPAGTRQDYGRVSIRHDLIVTTVPGARQGLKSRPCSQTGRGPG